MSERFAPEVLGVAVGREAIVVVADVAPGERTVQEWSVDPNATEPAELSSTWDEVFGECRRAFPRARRLAIALMPEIGHLRRLELPPMRDGDLVRHLARSASRYVPIRAEAWLATPARPGADIGGRWVAFASRAAVEALYAGGERAGFEIRCVVPAAIAWFSALEKLTAPEAARGWIVETVAPSRRSELHLLRITGDGHRSYRRFPATDVGLGALSGAHAAGSGPVQVVAEPSRTEALISALTDIGVEMKAGADEERAPHLSAALEVRGLPDSWFVSPDVIQRRRRSERRNVVRAVAASVVLLVASAAVHLRGLEREVNSLTDQRAGVAEPVSHALDLRTRLERLEVSVAELTGEAVSAPQWSVALGNLGAALPRTSHLTGFRASWDTIEVDAVAADAAEVFRELSASPWLDALRPVAAVQRDIGPEGRPVERVTLTGVVRADSRDPPSGGGG